MDKDLICPHCEYIEKDAWEINFGAGIEGDTEIMCNSCGEEYFCSRIVEIYYETAKLKEKNT